MLITIFQKLFPGYATIRFFAREIRVVGGAKELKHEGARNTKQLLSGLRAFVFNLLPSDRNRLER